MNIQINCPTCGSFDVILYKKDPNVYLGQDYYMCNQCGYVWQEKIKLVPHVNNKRKEKLKNERLKYLNWSKLKTGDIIDIILDLFEMGGRKFSKRKKRKIKNEKKNKRNNSSR